jgi:hypothetical protein
MGLSTGEAIGIVIGIFAFFYCACFCYVEMVNAYVGSRADVHSPGNRYYELASTPRGPGVIMPVIVSVGHIV